MIDRGLVTDISTVLTNEADVAEGYAGTEQTRGTARFRVEAPRSEA